jgi:hypothetical protein
MSDEDDNEPENKAPAEVARLSGEDDDDDEGDDEGDDDPESGFAPRLYALHFIACFSFQYKNIATAVTSRVNFSECAAALVTRSQLLTRFGLSRDFRYRS